MCFGFGLLPVVAFYLFILLVIDANAVTLAFLNPQVLSVVASS